MKMGQRQDVSKDGTKELIGFQITKGDIIDGYGSITEGITSQRLAEAITNLEKREV